jgi:hypothetical protein
VDPADIPESAKKPEEDEEEGEKDENGEPKSKKKSPAKRVSGFDIAGERAKLTA